MYRVKFETLTIGGHDYQIRSLADADQFHDPDGVAAERGETEGTWSYFGQVWASGVQLAEFTSAHPLGTKRILEIGCGLALGGIVCSRRGADVTASDRHPLAHEFLAANLALNGLPDMAFLDLDWTAPPRALGRFDLLIASDVLYEPSHPAELARFVERHLEVGGELVLVDPGRGGCGRLVREMEQIGLTARGDSLTSGVGAARRLRTLRFSA